METSIEFGGIAASLIITLILAIVYNFIPDIENKWKILVAVLLGLLFGLLKIPYETMPWNFVNILNGLFQGFLVGAGAVGIDQMKRNYKSSPGIPPISH